MTEPLTHAPETERALAENARYAASFDRPNLALPPARKLAVLACMDARLTVEDVLGLRTGDAHIIRNAGGLATDDAIRSLVISQRSARDRGGPRRRAHRLRHAHLRRRDRPANDRAGDRRRPSTCRSMPFPDLEANLVEPGRPGSEPIRGSKDVPVTGVIYEVETGRLRQVA